MTQNQALSHFLITGAAGFIGSHLVDHLLEQGHQVTGFDNLSHGFMENLSSAHQHPRFTFIKGDVQDLDACSQACQGVDYVLHQAALGSVPRSVKDPILYHQNNGTGTLNMLIAARDTHVRSFVLASSSSIYGNTTTSSKCETDTPSPLSPYAISKLLGEHYCSVFHHLYGLKTVSLRYFNVFGPRQNEKSAYAAVIPNFISAGLNDEAMIIHGDGLQARDFTFITNVVLANCLASQTDHQFWGQAINVGCGHQTSIQDLALLIQAMTKNTSPFQYTDSRKGDVPFSLSDTTRLSSLPDYQDPILLSDGLLETVDWYKNHLIKSIK